MKIKEINNEQIVFDNETTITYFHPQDCCESVYASFEDLLKYNIVPSSGIECSIFNIEFNDDIKNYIEHVDDLGFNLISVTGDKWFVSCHDEQNGYYSNDLELIIKNKDEVITFDITGCTEAERY